jgi:hypothetical protein
MGHPSTLTPADVERFERDGYVVVKQAFAPADGLAMEQRWWRELEDTHHVRRDDRSTWRPIVGDLRAAKRDPIQTRILTGRVRGVLDDLLGGSRLAGTEGLGPLPGHVPRAGRLAGADPALALGQPG